MGKALDFLREVRVELTKVIWPNLDQVIKLTVIVVIVTLAVGFFLGAIDFLLAEGLRILISAR
jgi:preprotein translocase subunit SecE